MFKTHFCLGNNHLKKAYKVYVNKLTKIKNLSKMDYFERELRNNSSNPRKTWDTLQSLLPTKSNKSTNLPTKLLANDIELSNPKAIVESFNNFFSDIGPKLAEKFDWTNKASFKTFLKNRVTSSLFLDPVGI